MDAINTYVLVYKKREHTHAFAFTEPTLPELTRSLGKQMLRCELCLNWWDVFKIRSQAHAMVMLDKPVHQAQKQFKGRI